MEKASFSDSVETALRKAGWHPERRLSPEEMKSWCALREETKSWCAIRDGSVPLIIHPVAYSALQEFGGLKITFGEGDSAHILNFDPLEAMTSWFEYGWIVGQPIFPIAVYHREDDDSNDNKIGIDTAGRVWLMAYDLYLIGHNINEAIEFLAGRLHASATAPEPFEPDNFEIKGDEANQLRDVIQEAMRFTL